jgi:hypothetical protein
VVVAGEVGHNRDGRALGVSKTTVERYIACVRKGESARTHLFLHMRRTCGQSTD